MWRFFSVSVHEIRNQNMSAYFRNTLYKDSYVYIAQGDTGLCEDSSLFRSMKYVTKICPPISETLCIRILAYSICQAPCLLHAYDEIPLFYTRFFSSIWNTNGVYRSLKIDFLRVTYKIISKNKISLPIYRIFTWNLMGCECHSDLNIMRRATEETHVVVLVTSSQTKVYIWIPS